MSASAFPRSCECGSRSPLVWNVNVATETMIWRHESVSIEPSGGGLIDSRVLQT